MPGISKNARRNARRRQRKRKDAADKREEKRQEYEAKLAAKAEANPDAMCGICATPFCTDCPNCCRAKVPIQHWLEMGCECEAPKICILCSVTHVKNTAKKHCLEIDCTRKAAKCPWCRCDMDVTDVYDNADIRHSGTGRSLFEDLADLTLDE